MAKPAEYKPLLYTTTVRNPERYKDFIHLLKSFDGQILTADIVEQFERESFKCGLYRPVKRIPISAKDKGKYKEEILGNMPLPTKKPKSSMTVTILICITI